jgi:DNA-binding GntR family transcriptional regulator
MVEAIAARDGDAAEDAAKRHVAAVVDSYLPDPGQSAAAVDLDAEGSV